ncbi:MAG: hypothetical protein H6509_11990 [Bryobacterales bacterium]|nr:hypothetical protein [Bryobacterales bacterium]
MQERRKNVIELDALAIRDRIAKAKKSLLFWIPCAIGAWVLFTLWRRSFEGSPGKVAGLLVVAAALVPVYVSLSKIHTIAMGYVGLAVHRRTQK